MFASLSAPTTLARDRQRGPPTSARSRARATLSGPRGSSQGGPDSWRSNGCLRRRSGGLSDPEVFVVAAAVRVCDYPRQPGIVLILYLINSRSGNTRQSDLDSRSANVCPVPRQTLGRPWSDTGGSKVWLPFRTKPFKRVENDQRAESSFERPEPRLSFPLASPLDLW